MTTAPKAAKSLYGQKFAVSTKGNIVGEGGAKDMANQYRQNITHQAVTVTGTISAEGATVANQRDISLQLKDINGDNVNVVTPIRIVALLNAAGTDFAATGGSTGIAQGAVGKLLAQVAKKMFQALTSATGALTFTYTDTGTEAVYLGIIMPSGDMIVCGNLTNA